jgi:hypothetical protein
LGFLQAVIGRFGATWGGGTSETDFCGSRLKMTDRNEEGRRVLGIRVTMTLAPFRMQEDLCKGVSFCWSPTAWLAEIYTIRGTYIYITVLSYPVDMLGFARSRYRACFSGDPVAEYRPRAREGGNQPSGRLWDERV